MATNTVTWFLNALARWWPAPLRQVVLETTQEADRAFRESEEYLGMRREILSLAARLDERTALWQDAGRLYQHVRIERDQLLESQSQASTYRNQTLAELGRLRSECTNLKTALKKEQELSTARLQRARQAEQEIEALEKELEEAHNEWDDEPSDELEEVVKAPVRIERAKRKEDIALELGQLPKAESRLPQHMVRMVDYFEAGQNNVEIKKATGLDMTEITQARLLWERQQPKDQPT